MQEDLYADFVIIGAGVVGLAIGAKLAQSGLSVLVLEQCEQFGCHSSSRNSEVIHAGIYYPQDSLKARFCVEGKNLLYRWAKAKKIPYQKIGKLIVATTEQEVEKLHAIRENASKNGVEDLAFVNSKDKQSTPLLQYQAALHSPSSGIIDSHNLMRSFEYEIEQHQGIVSYLSRVDGLDYKNGNWQITCAQEQSKFRISSKFLINAAGLWASEILNLLVPLQEEWRQFFVKGSYFKISQKWTQINSLVYPVPPEDQQSLGIHLTLDLEGNIKFGPDAEPQDDWTYWEEDSNPDYSVSENRAEIFKQSIQRYFPSINNLMLIPDQAGIRPKVPQNDFLILTEQDHGQPNFVSLLGIESPGLTASMAIARYVHQHLVGQKNAEWYF